MGRLLAEAMDAGASGLSAQRMGPRSVQRDYDGTPMATDLMHDETMLALAQVLAERNDGFIQFIAPYTGALTFSSAKIASTSLPISSSVSVASRCSRQVRLRHGRGRSVTGRRGRQVCAGRRRGGQRPPASGKGH